MRRGAYRNEDLKRAKKRYLQIKRDESRVNHKYITSKFKLKHEGNNTETRKKAQKNASQSHKYYKKGRTF